MNNDWTEPTLNDKQYAFMAKHHETVELGVIMLNFFHERTIIDGLKNNQDYRRLFGEMVWDDIYDRYESHPKYDKSFRLKVVHQFQGLGFGK